MPLRNEDEYTIVERMLKKVCFDLIQAMAILIDSHHPMYERVYEVSKQLESVVKSLKTERDKL